MKISNKIFNGGVDRPHLTLLLFLILLFFADDQHFTARVQIQKMHLVETVYNFTALICNVAWLIVQHCSI